MTPEEMIASLLETLREAVIEERTYDSSNGWIDKAELLIEKVDNQRGKQ